MAGTDGSHRAAVTGRQAQVGRHRVAGSGRALERLCTRTRLLMRSLRMWYSSVMPSFLSLSFSYFWCGPRIRVSAWHVCSRCCSRLSTGRLERCDHVCHGRSCFRLRSQGDRMTFSLMDRSRIRGSVSFSDHSAAFADLLFSTFFLPAHHSIEQGAHRCLLLLLPLLLPLLVPLLLLPLPRASHPPCPSSLASTLFSSLPPAPSSAPVRRFIVMPRPRPRAPP